jgi:flagellar motor switch protein FliM
MADTLSQKDIDSLLKGGAAAAKPKKQKKIDVIPYNFRRPPRVAKEKQATLEMIYGRFAMALQTMLSTHTRTPTDVVVGSVEQATFAEFTFSLADPCAAFVFNLSEDSSDSGVVDFGTEFAYYLIDRLFGGPGESSDMTRATTPLERLVLKGVGVKVLGLLSEVWEEHLMLRPTDVVFESTPETMQVVEREDNVLVANLEVRSGSFAGWLSLCLPLSALESFLQTKSSRATRKLRQTRTAGEEQMVELGVRGARLPVSARFPVFRMAVKDMSSVQPGAVIHTGRELDQLVEVHVNGKPRFRGSVGRVRHYIGLQITQTLDEAADGTSDNEPRGKVL